MLSRKTWTTVLLLLLFVSPQALLAQFADIDDSVPQFEAINAFTELGIVEGYKIDNTFRPNQPITRAEALKVILLSGEQTADPNEEPLELPFTDIDPTDWYPEFVRLGYRRNFIEGYEEDNTFRPHNPITLAEAVKIGLVTHYDNLTVENIGDNLTVLPEQNELLTIPTAVWFTDFMEYAYRADLLPQPETELDITALAQSPISRAELVDFLYRLRLTQLGETFTGQSVTTPIIATPTGIVSQLPEPWQYEAVGDKVVFYRLDPQYTQAFISRVYPNSAHIVIEILTPNPTLSNADVIDGLQAEYRELHGNTVEFTETEQNDQDVLIAEYSGARDLYLFLADREILTAQASYGSGSETLALESQVQQIQDSLQKLDPQSAQELADQFAVSQIEGLPSAPEKTEDPIITAPLSLYQQARLFVLKKGAGRAALQLFPDLESINERVNEATGDPVVYYYSEIADVTLKYDPKNVTLLALREGREKGF